LPFVTTATDAPAAKWPLSSLQLLLQLLLLLLLLLLLPPLAVLLLSFPDGKYNF